MWGEKCIKLGGEYIHLKATMLALKNINTRFGGLRTAANSIENLDLQAGLYILSQATGRSEQELEKLLQEHFFEIFQVAAQYIVFLANGGKEKIEESEEIRQQEAVSSKEKVSQ